MQASVGGGVGSVRGETGMRRFPEVRGRLRRIRSVPGLERKGGTAAGAAEPSTPAANLQTGRKFRLTDFAFGYKDFFFKVLAPEIPGSHDDWEERHYSENQRPDSAFEVSVRAESAESQQSPPGFQSCLGPSAPAPRGI